MDQSLKPKTTAADFFLHLGVVAVLYVFVGFLINLVFTVIDVAYPPIEANYYISPSISFPVAALIVLFPVFILLSYITLRSYETDSTKKQLGVRKWLTFLTLFITGAVVAGDLITIIYYFLDGRDLTASFLLKAVTLLLVAIIIFVYYSSDIREKLSSSQRKIWLLVSLVLTIGAIIAGFSVIGSPASQRMSRYDQQKISDLQNIQWQIVNYWQAKQLLPKNLLELKDPIGGQIIPTDPQTTESYVYETTGALSFKLCATFNIEGPVNVYKSEFARIPEPASYPKGASVMEDNWRHGKGLVCFDRTIDPDRYPPNPKKSI